MTVKRLSNILVVIGVLTAGCLFVFDKADTASQSGSIDINVQMTVPPSPPGGGGGVILDAMFPVISDVTSSVDSATATVYWTATDNMGIQNCTFEYGLTMSYGSVAVPNASAPYYSVDLSALASGTLYYYSINCADFVNNITSAPGTFSTLAPEFTGQLIIIGKPEKRVFKTGGNLSMSGVLYLYHPVTKALVYSTDVSLNNAGSSTLRNGAIPTGNFEAVLKGESHLAKMIINVSVQNGLNTTLDFSDGGHFYLLAGDVRRAGGGDNFIDILDVSAINIKFNSSEQLYDLNYDGIVDVLDLSAVLVNYNKRGDVI